MRIRLSFILISLLCTVGIYAQSTEVQHFEGELFGGVTFPAESYHDSGTTAAPNFGFEVRYNFNNSPLDCGIFLQVEAAGHDFKSYRSQLNRTVSIGFLGDYNFRQGAKVNPYIGIGIGVAHNDVVGDEHIVTNGISAAFIPRIGVELLHHIRLSTYCQLSRKGYNTFGLSIGFVIGGRPKK